MSESLVHESIDILTKSKFFGSKDKLLAEAVRTLLEVKPSFKIEIAIELYKKGTISMSRACEIAGVSSEGFKEILSSRGIIRHVKAPTKEKMKKEVDLILWESGILTKNEVQETILKIEQKDNTRIRDIQKILE